MVSLSSEECDSKVSELADINERSFSSLKRIKIPFRSSMTTQRLMGLTLLTVHHDIPVDIAEAIQEVRCLLWLPGHDNVYA